MRKRHLSGYRKWMDGLCIVSLNMCKFNEFAYIFPVDRVEHMTKPCAKLFFHFVYTQDEKKIAEGFQDICFHYLGNQNILSIALKKKINFRHIF